jgi:eukaryotic-like serine/threonine-protein kinase
MNPELDKLETIFEAARQLGEPERANYLAEACGEDETLRHRVKEMLQAEARARDFFGGPGAVETKTLKLEDLREGASEDIGSRIGRYKLLQKIGEGGMGLVYMAEQEQPVRRRVALKIIKLGMDTRQVVARFEAERQALALMDHPNIAKVLDGGATEAGRPYFVMELVQGVPITDFCDKNHFSTQERIQLFIPVCQAMQSAHQKGIIHRDLKPSNILVTLNAGQPVPKVIDFGIAKAINQKLTEKTLFTNYATMIGTPAYMSPEQAEMSSLDVDIRTDIYSLGVVLYELLTGTTPFPEKRLRSVGYNEMQRIIVEEEPVRPSTRLSTLQGEQRSLVAKNRGASELTLDKLFPGDLDWIVMKCLEKDRARRYESASGLAMDIQRHLDNEPVVARPPSAVYRFQKLVRRNRLIVGAATALLATLVLGIVGSAWQAVRATRAERVARIAQTKERGLRQAADTARQDETRQRQRAETGESNLVHELYVAKMNNVRQAWDENSLKRVQTLLQETSTYPDRGFEWYYWQRQVHLALKTFCGQRSGIQTIAYSPDGQRIATGSVDGAVGVWEVASGRQLFVLQAHHKMVNSVAYSPDGQRLVSGSEDGQAIVWDAVSGRELARLADHIGEVSSVTFAPNSRQILTGCSDGSARLWAADTGTNLLTLSNSSWPIYSAAFSPDGRRVVVGSEELATKVWDLTTRTQSLTLKGVGQSVAFSPDGQRIITGSPDGSARIWDAATGACLFTLSGHKDWIMSVAFSPDNRRVVTGSMDQTIKVWEAATGSELFSLKGHIAEVTSVAFSPDGERIASGSLDRTVKIWEAAHSREGLTLEGQQREPLIGLVFSPDGKRVGAACFDGTAKLWDASSGRKLHDLRGHTGRVWALAFSPDSRHVATGGDDKTAIVWETATGTPLFTLAGHQNTIKGVAFSPDGLRVATCGDSAKVWVISTRSNCLTLTREAVVSIAFSPDGTRLLTACGEATAKLWDASSGRELITFRGHTEFVRGIAFSPDGRRIATGSWDHTGRIWDARSGPTLAILTGHGGRVPFVAFSPDGNRVLTGSFEQTVRFWKADTGRELLALKAIGNSGAAFSPDGKRIVSALRVGDDQFIGRIWEAASIDQVASWQEEDRLFAASLADKRIEPGPNLRAAPGTAPAADGHD